MLDVGNTLILRDYSLGSLSTELRHDLRKVANHRANNHMVYSRFIPMSFLYNELCEKKRRTALDYSKVSIFVTCA